MFRKNHSANAHLGILLFIVSGLFYSCSPTIKFFEVNNQTITSEDSLIFNWGICGKPMLLYHEQPAADSGRIKPIDGTAKFLDYTLVVTKGGKEKSQTIQVVMLPKESADSIIFRSELSANGDTIIARGEKNPKRWGHLFEITTVSSYTGISLSVIHNGKSAELDKNGSSSDALKGTPVEGHWEFRHLLTASEKNNPPQSLEFLRIHTTIQYKRR